jgi:hypothetical protein
MRANAQTSWLWQIFRPLQGSTGPRIDRAARIHVFDARRTEAVTT